MVRRRRAMRMVAASIMGAAIRPQPILVKMQTVIPGGSVSTRPGISRFRVRCGARHRAALGADPLASPRNDYSDRRIPRRRHHAVAAAVLFDMAKPGERIVEALNLQLLGHHHVVDP